MNKQVQERCRKLEHYALRISERYDNVEKVVIKILKSASGMEAGTEYEYNKDSKAYFFSFPVHFRNATDPTPVLISAMKSTRQYTLARKCRKCRKTVEDMETFHKIIIAITS